MRALSLSRKAAIAAVSVFLLCFGSAGAGLWVAATLSDEVDSAVASGALMRNHLGADMMHDAIRADVLAALLAAGSAGVADARLEFDEHANELDQYIAANEAAGLPPRTRDLSGKVRGLLSEYVASAAGIIDLAKTDPAQARAGMDDFATRFREVEAALEEISVALGEETSASAEAAKQRAGRARFAMAALCALGLAFASGLTLAVRRAVVRPIENVTFALDRLAGGDMSAEPPTARADDEIGRMTKAIAVFREAMIGRQSEVEARKQREAADAARERHEAIQRAQEEERNAVVSALAEALDHLAAGRFAFRIQHAFPAEYRKLKDDFNEAIASLEGVVRTITHAADATRRGTGEIAGSAEDLSRRTAAQAASLEEMVAALEAMTGGFRSTAQGAEKARLGVADVRLEAQKSGEVVTRAVEAMGAIHASASEVSKIIGVIDEIAFQTSLLALNAGVEAARAGDAGKGFAVVAQEVRALAQRSAESAKEIKGLISASTEQVGVGVELVGETGEALSRMAGKVGEIDALVSGIAAGAKEQAQRLAEINTSASQMDQATRQNAALAEEMTTVGHNLAGEAQDLSELVGRFEVGDGDAREWRMAG